MNASEVQSLVATVDELIFSHTGEHLDDLEQAILEGVLEHQKYAEIAKNYNRSAKYIKERGRKLWQALSASLDEEVSKSNIKSTLQRYYYNFSNTNVINSVQINRGNICNKLPENELKQSEVYQHRYFILQLKFKININNSSNKKPINEYLFDLSGSYRHCRSPSPRSTSNVNQNYSKSTQRT